MKAVFSIWWDDTLGPMVGRSYPQEYSLSNEEALVVFMGHGINQEAKMGYTKLKRGLIISYLDTPNCIAVLLDDDDDSAVVERNLLRLIPTINFHSQDWDKEIKEAFECLEDLIDETSGDNLLQTPGIDELVEDLVKKRLKIIKPVHIFKYIVRYPDAAQYLGKNNEEVQRILKDLENEGVLIQKSYGRSIECRQCGSTEMTISLHCPKCDSSDLHNVYTVFCPECSNQFHTVLMDDLEEIQCQKCSEPVRVDKLAVLNVEPLCNECGTASDDPLIHLRCAVCGKRQLGADLLGATGLAYYPSKTKS